MNAIEHLLKRSESRTLACLVGTVYDVEPFLAFTEVYGGVCEMPKRK